LFKFLSDKKKEIENKLREQAERIDSQIASSIKIRKEFENILEPNTFSAVFEWLYDKTKLFQRIFPKYFAGFKKH